MQRPLQFARPGFHSGLVFFLCALSCVCGLSFLQGRVAQAEDESGQLAFPDPEPDPEIDYTAGMATRPRPQQPSQMSGVDGRIGFIGLPTFGRDASILPLELFPYVQSDNRILFGDLRGFLTTDGRVGANVGVGFRFIEPNDVALFGVNGFYDADGTTGRMFQQLSVGWEARTKMFGHFGNVYIPVGSTSRVLAQSVFNPRFDDHSILLDVRSRTGQAMSGMDLNLQAFLPGDFAQEHQVQVTAGWYSFQASGTHSINGAQVQMQGNIVPAVTLATSLTHDRTFGTNFSIGGFFRFGTRELPEIDLNGQLRRFVNRNYNVIVSEKTTLQTGVDMINPLTGSAYVVQHVGTNTGTGDGSVSNPFTNITDAQNVGADLIFVQGGTTITDTVTLADGQSLFGEGTSATLNDARYGAIGVPLATTSALPAVIQSSGTGVIMGNNTQLAGIVIENTGGRGIEANGIDNFRIEDVVIDTPGGDGIWVSNSSDGVISDITMGGVTGNGITLVDIDDVMTLNNIYIDGTTGAGISIAGGSGEIYFHDQLVVRDAGTTAFEVMNLETVTTVDDRGTPSVLDDITTTTPGLVSVDQLVVRNTTGGSGIGLTNNAGVIGFGAVDIETANASALLVRNTENLQVVNGYLTSTGAPTADVEGSGINVALTTLNATGGTYGMRFVDTEGQFTVYGTGSLGTGGLISQTTTGLYMEDGPGVALQTLNFANNGSVALINGGDSLILTGSNITQTSNYLIDATNLTMLQIYDSQFANNSLSSGNGILYRVNTSGSYTASVTYNTASNIPVTFFRTETQSGGEGASLAYNFQGNTVTLSNANTQAAALNWTGPVTAYALNNTIVGNAAGQTAFQMYTGDSSDQAGIMVSQNTITMNGANSIGVDIDTQSGSTTYVTSNAIKFNGLNGIGVQADLWAAGGINVSGNQIVDSVGGATGILFGSVEHLSTIVVNSNSIDLSYASTFVDRGIVLSSVMNDAGVDDPFVTFVSTSSNTVSGATTPYSLPATGAKGTLLINDTSVQ